jgi:hypothetical protein
MINADPELTERLGRVLEDWQLVVDIQRWALLPEPADQHAGRCPYLHRGLAFLVLAMIEGLDPAEWGQG